MENYIPSDEECLETIRTIIEEMRVPEGLDVEGTVECLIEKYCDERECGQPAGKKGGKLMEYIIERDCGSAFCFSKHRIEIKTKGDMAASKKLKQMQEEAVAKQLPLYPVKVRRKGGRKYL